MELNQIELNQKSQMMFFINNYKVIIDTCSLLHEGAASFWNNVEPVLQKNNKKIIVPEAVASEIKKHMRSKKEDLKYNANKVYKKLLELQDKSIIKVLGDESEKQIFADNIIFSVVARFRIQQQILVITNDQGLAKDLETLNSSNAVRNKTVKVRKINRFGYLSKFSFQKEPGIVNNNTCNSYSARKQDQQNFYNDNSLLPTCKCQSGTTLYMNNGTQIVLGEQIQKGGEALLFSVQNNMSVVKVFRPQYNTGARYHKIKELIHMNNIPNVAWPQAIVYSDTMCRCPVGYVMKKIEGRTLLSSVFKAKLLKKYYPGICKRSDLIKICIQIMKTAKILHENGILIGDVSAKNIILQYDGNICFVDIDSCLYKGYRQSVLTPMFVAPELISSEKPYTKSSEYFVLAMLIFSILHLGKHPYSQSGGDDPVSDTATGDFSFPLQEQRNGRTSAGPFRFMWSHLSFNTKKAFFETFKAGQEHYDVGNRITPGQWIGILHSYLTAMPKMLSNDEMADDLFPTRFKRVKYNQKDTNDERQGFEFSPFWVAGVVLMAAIYFLK